MPISIRTWKCLGIGLILLSGLLLASIAAWAQPAAGAHGLRANLQGADSGISLPIWTDSGKIVFEPAIAFARASDAGTDLGFGALLRFNMRQDRVTPYYGVRVLEFFFSPEDGDGTTDFLFGPVLGGEYFLDEGFSLSVEAQVNVTKSDEFSGRFRLSPLLAVSSQAVTRYCLLSPGKGLAMGDRAGHDGCSGARVRARPAKSESIWNARTCDATLNCPQPKRVLTGGPCVIIIRVRPQDRSKRPGGLRAQAEKSVRP